MNEVFKVGDRVEILIPSFLGKFGRIVTVTNEELAPEGWNYGVCLDEEHEACHTLGNQLKQRSGLWACSAQIKLAE